MQTTPFSLNLFAARTSVYAWLVALVAAVRSAINLAPDVFPGDSAMLIAQHAGIDVFSPLTHIVWGWAGNLMAHLPFGTLGVRWNLLSALCGAASCGLVVLLTVRLTTATKKWRLVVPSPFAMGNLAGVVAGLLLAFCLPFQVASAIALPATFELLGLLTSGWLLIRFAETGTRWRGFAAMALLAITLTQYTTALLIAPVLFVCLLMILWRKKQFTARNLISYVLVFVSTAGVFFLTAAWLFSRQPGYVSAEMAGIGDVLFYMAQDFYRELRHGTPIVAIVLVILFSLLPFLVVVLLAGSRGPGSLALQLITLVIGVLLFMNIRFAPWPMFGLRPLLLMPYVIAAVWLGYLSIFLIGSLQSAMHVQFRFRRSKHLSTVLRAGCFILLAVFVFASAASSWHRLQIGAAMAITRHADMIASQLTDGAWLVVDGQLEPLVRIKAREQGKTPVFLSIQRFNHIPYQNTLSTELNNPRLASMVRMGIVPLIRERLHPDHTPAPPMAVIGDPSLFRFVAGTAWPDRTLYWLDEPEAVQPEAYLQMQQDFWRTLSRAESSHPFSDLEHRFLTHSARIANDAGVWLQDQQRPDLAAQAFREAHQLDPYNLSARLNARALMSDDDAEAAALDEDIEALSANLRGKRTLTQITDLYGQIRHEAALRESERRWSRTDATPPLDERFEAVLRQTNDLEALRALEAIPGADNAMKLGMTRIAVNRGRPALAEKIIAGLPQTGPLARAILIERANIDIQLGRRENAYQALTSIPETEIDDPRILIMLALLTVEDKPQECDRYLEKLEEFPNLLVSLWQPIARIHEARGNTDKAVTILSQLHAAQPLNIEVMRSLIRLHLDQGHLTEAMKITRSLLILNPRDPLANAALSLYLASSDRPTEAVEAKIIALAGNPDLKKYFEKVNE